MPALNCQQLAILKFLRMRLQVSETGAPRGLVVGWGALENTTILPLAKALNTHQGPKTPSLLQRHNLKIMNYSDRLNSKQIILHLFLKKKLMVHFLWQKQHGI